MKNILYLVVFKEKKTEEMSVFAAAAIILVIMGLLV